MINLTVKKNINRVSYANELQDTIQILPITSNTILKIFRKLLKNDKTVVMFYLLI